MASFLELPYVTVSSSEVLANAGEVIEVGCVASGNAGETWERVGTELDPPRVSRF